MRITTRRSFPTIFLLLMVLVPVLYYSISLKTKSTKQTITQPVLYNSISLKTKSPKQTITQPLPYGSEINEVLNVVRIMNVKSLLVTLINRAFIPFTLSWLCNTKHMNIHKQLLIIVTDTYTKEKIQQLWPLINIVSISGMSLHGNQSYSHAGYVKLTNFRAHVLLELLLIKQEILLCEVDALWIKNPVPILSKYTGYDILANPVAERPGITAIGFLYLFPTNGTIATWRELNRQLYELDEKIKSFPQEKLISEQDNDQIYLSRLVSKTFGGLTKKELPLTNFADGKWYTYSQEKRKSFHPYVINNNWIIGNQNKIARAIEWGHWFLYQNNSCNYELVNRITTVQDVNDNYL